jgi:hypothetical protein
MLHGVRAFRALVVDYTSGMRQDKRMCVKGDSSQNAFLGMIPPEDREHVYPIRDKDQDGYWFWCARTQFKDYFLWEEARPIRKNMSFEDLIDEPVV